MGKGWSKYGRYIDSVIRSERAAHDARNMLHQIDFTLLPREVADKLRDALTKLSAVEDALFVIKDVALESAPKLPQKRKPTN